MILVHMHSGATEQILTSEVSGHQWAAKRHLPMEIVSIATFSHE